MDPAPRDILEEVRKGRRTLSLIEIVFAVVVVSAVWWGIRQAAS